MNEAIIIIFCDEGFGDQYASLITAYNVIPILRKQGYNPKIFISKEHKYFSLKTPISVIYNLSIFDCDIEEMRYEEIKQRLGGHKLVSFSSIQIWVKEKNNELDDFNYSNVTRYNIHNLTTHPKTKENLVNKDILELSEKFISERKNIVALHFRSGDTYMKSDINHIMQDSFWNEQFKKSYEFIETNSEYDVLICSSNSKVVDHFCEKYKNTFRSEFSNPNMPMHRIYGHDFQEDDSSYITHAKEIYSEMVSLKYAKKIFSVNHFSSNFVLYGILNNVNYDTWQEKLTNLVYAGNI